MPISPNFELSHFNTEGDTFVLEFPDHIHRDEDGDPHLSLIQLIELKYLLEDMITSEFHIH